jgi:hypothetical protein
VKLPDGGMLTAQAASGWDPITRLHYIESDDSNPTNCEFVV